MRKYIIGFVVGILMTTAGVVGADTVSKIGKKVQSEAVVTLDGNEIGTALIIDGVSYPPLRVVAEASGLSVDYEKGVVSLKTQTVDLSQNKSYLEASVKRLTEHKQKTIEMIEKKEQAVIESKEVVERWKNKLSLLSEDTSEETKKGFTDTVSDLELDHLKLESELQQYKNRLLEIETELIETINNLNKLNESTN